MKPTITLAMIVRNEEDNLPGCLESARHWVDEIVIVDTGSGDRTPEIARRYTAKVYTCPWRDDFSAARNFALEQATGSWILCLDADERLDATGGDLRSLIKKHPHREAFLLPLHNPIPEIPGSYTRFPVLRLFRNKPAYRFRGKIHEQVTVHSPGAVGLAPAPVIWHRPLSVRERRRKRGRNIALLQRALAKDPLNPFLLYYLGVEWLGLGKPGYALPCLERAYREISDEHILFRAPAVRYLVAALRGLGRLDEAICLCLKEALRYSDYTDLFFDGGVVLEEKGEYEVAVRWFEEAVNCGQPPSHFVHTCGTDGFLSLYHLGHCLEKLGRLEEAEKFYARALAANPDYLPPLYHLFLLLLTTRGARAAYDYFKLAGHLHQPRQATVLADLFFEAGYSGLARACLKEGPAAVSGESTRQLVKFSLYSGHTEEALTLAESLLSEKHDPDLAVGEILGLIVQGDYGRAREKALRLWQYRHERSRALAMLGLITHLKGGRKTYQPEDARRPEVIKALLGILENCLCHAPHAGKWGLNTEGWSRLVKGITCYLAYFSPEGAAALCGYLEEKAASVRIWMERRYGPARELVP